MIKNLLAILKPIDKPFTKTNGQFQHPLLSRYHLYAACPPRRRYHNPSLGAREVSPPAAAAAESPCEAALAAASARTTRNEFETKFASTHLFYTTRLSPIILACICPPQPTPTARLATAAHACRLATTPMPWEGVGCSCGLDAASLSALFGSLFPPNFGGALSTAC